MHGILRIDRFVIHACQIQNALNRIQDCRVFTDELEGVAIARYHQDLETLVCCLVGKTRQYVVGFVIVSGDVFDVHGIERFAKQLSLSHEFGRGLSPCSLVFGVLLGAKGFSRKIESDRQVGWFLG